MTQKTEIKKNSDNAWLEKFPQTKSNLLNFKPRVIESKELTLQIFSPANRILEEENAYLSHFQKILQEETQEFDLVRISPSAGFCQSPQDLHLQHL